MRFAHEITIPLPASSIDLPEWLFDLTEAEYAACARGHRGLGVQGGSRRTGMINVESIGGSLLVQHYETRRADKDHVTMVSEASRAYLMHVAPVKVGVVWDMQVMPDGPTTSRFPLRDRRRDAASRPPPRPDHRHARSSSGATSSRKTKGFARDIARKHSAEP